MKELKPRYIKQQSFYKKAHVAITETGCALYSYNTKVAEVIDNELHVFNMQSATTVRHIKEFAQQYYRARAITTKELRALMEKGETL